MTEGPSLTPGTVLEGKYKILRQIGRGGMAEVFAAHHEILHQTVALKVLLPEVAETPHATARFINEARAAARIRGEHIATVMDVGTLPNGTAYMVLEYLDGQDLEELVNDRGPLPAGDAVDYVLQALQAIAQAHAGGIIHRDLKPSNLFLARQHDGSALIKVLDFGISKSHRPEDVIDGDSTSSRAILGSPFYMAPEQARSAKSVDPRADIWAIGVISYRLLTGKLPFRGETLTELLLAIVQDTPAPLRHHRPELPAELEAIVERCLRKDRAERFANVADLAAALQPFGGPDAGRSVSRIARTLAVVAPTDPPPPLPTSEAAPAASNEGTPAVSAPRLELVSSRGPATTASWAEASASKVAPRRASRSMIAIAALALAGVAAAVVVTVEMRAGDGRPAGASSVSAGSAIMPPALVTSSPRLAESAPASPAVSSSAAPVPSAAVATSARPVHPAAPSRPTASAAAGKTSPPPAITAPPAPTPTFNVLDQRN